MFPHPALISTVQKDLCQKGGVHSQEKHSVNAKKYDRGLEKKARN